MLRLEPDVEVCRWTRHESREILANDSEIRNPAYVLEESVSVSVVIKLHVLQLGVWFVSPVLFVQRSRTLAQFFFVLVLCNLSSRLRAWGHVVVVGAMLPEIFNVLVVSHDEKR